MLCFMCMKLQLLVLLHFLMYAPFLHSSGSIPESGVQITISGLRNDKGNVLISLFRNDRGFPGEPQHAFRTYRLYIRSGKSITSISDLPSGNYAIAVLHDENGDLTMNKNWLGIPKEGFGFSNNAMGTFGPPAFSKARVQVEKGQVSQLEINIRYF